MPFRYLLIIFFVVLLFGCGHAEKPNLEEKAVDFKLKDLKGNSVAIGEYKDKNPVLLFFWTTWCPFCRIELKALEHKYPQLKKEGWEVLVINVAEPVYRVDNFLARYKFSFNVLLDADGKVASSYGLLGVPTYVVIDKKGSVRSKGNHFPATYQDLVSK